MAGGWGAGPPLDGDLRLAEVAFTLISWSMLLALLDLVGHRKGQVSM